MGLRKFALGLALFVVMLSARFHFLLIVVWLPLYLRFVNLKIVILIAFSIEKLVNYT